MRALVLATVTAWGCGRIGFDPPGVVGVDPTFGDGGIAHLVLEQGTDGQAIALDQQGRIVIAGFTRDGGLGQNWVARFAADGTIDSTFDGGVLRVEGDGAGTDRILVDPAGRILTFGWVPGTGSIREVRVRRILTEGQLDPSFGVGGSTVSGIEGQAQSGAVFASGRIVTVGFNGDDWQLTGFDGAGQVDAGFGAAGMVVTDAGGNDRAIACDVDSLDRLWVAGHGDNTGGPTAIVVGRYFVSGQPDATWGVGGVASAKTLPGDESATAVTIDGARLIVASYRFNGVWQVQRWIEPGTLDPTFATAGTYSFDLDDTMASANAVAIDPSGGIVIAGEPGLRLVRLTADGQVDSEFSLRHDGDGVSVNLAPSDADAALNGCVIDRDGQLLCVGHDSTSAVIVRVVL